MFLLLCALLRAVCAVLRGFGRLGGLLPFIGLATLPRLNSPSTLESAFLSGNLSGMQELNQGRVKRVRLALGMTQDQFAHKLTCSTKTVSLCEQRDRLPRALAILENFRKLERKVGLKAE